MFCKAVWRIIINTTWKGAGRVVKARLVDGKRAASTYCSYQNENQKPELEEASPQVLPSLNIYA